MVCHYEEGIFQCPFYLIETNNMVKTPSISKADMLGRLNERIGDRLTVVDIPNYQNTRSKVHVHCAVHGNCWSFGSPWLPRVANILYNKDSIQLCPKCAKNYQPTPDELLAELQALVVPPLSVVAVVDACRGAHNNCHIRCDVHGNCWQWDRPWEPTVNQIKSRNVRCLKCSGKYRLSVQELKDMLSTRLAPMLRLIDINSDRRCVFECTEHGRSDEWGSPWYPRVADVRYKEQIRCIKCIGLYERTETEWIEYLNGKAPPGKRVVAICDFKKAHSRCVTECDEHGRSDQWNNPMTHSFQELLSPNAEFCAKCSGSYSMTKTEAMGKAVKVLPAHLTLLDILDHSESGTRARCVVECQFHGLGSKMSPAWYPAYNKLAELSGCPICRMATWLLAPLVQASQEEQSQTALLYFIEFIHVEERFFKIGVCSVKGLKQRYRPTQLKRDGLLFARSQSVKLPKLQAMQAELWALIAFASDRVDKKAVLTHVKGGSECFAVDITKRVALADIAKLGLMAAPQLNKAFGQDSYGPYRARSKMKRKLARPKDGYWNQKVPEDWGPNEWQVAYEEHGSTLKALAEALGVDRKTVANYRDKFELDWSKPTKEQMHLDTVKAMATRGYAACDIAKAIGVSVSSVQKWTKKYHIILRSTTLVQKQNKH